MTGMVDGNQGHRDRAPASTPSGTSRDTDRGSIRFAERPIFHRLPLALGLVLIAASAGLLLLGVDVLRGLPEGSTHTAVWGAGLAGSLSLMAVGIWLSLAFHPVQLFEHGLTHNRRPLRGMFSPPRVLPYSSIQRGILTQTPTGWVLQLRTPDGAPYPLTQNQFSDPISVLEFLRTKLDVVGEQEDA